MHPLPPLLFCALQALTSLQAPALYEVTVAPRIDAALSDWRDVPGFAIQPRDPETGEPDPRAPAAAWAQLAFDSAFLYLALRVPDDTLAFPERSWRFGDGFYFTVLVPGTGTRSREHVSFGFSRVGHALERTLVNRSGEYFPAADLGDIRFAMAPGPAVLPMDAAGAVPWNGDVVYEAAIPWRLLFPARPLLVDSLCLNIIVVDRDGSAARHIALLEQDGEYDTERTPYRRGRMLPLHRAAQTGASFSAAVSRRGVDVRAGIAVTYGARGVLPDPHLQVEVWQEQGRIGEWRGQVASGAGLRRGRVHVMPDTIARTGAAVVRTRIGQRVYEDSIFLYVAPELARIAAELDALEGRAREAIPTAHIRMQWLETERDSAAANAPLERALGWWRELTAIRAALRNGHDDFLQAAGVQRLAHRSRLDGTLQPYSLHLPDGFEPALSATYPVLVVLHGSGVDEAGTIRSWGPAAAARGWVVIAPRGRGLSDWYLGAAETDVLEVIDHACALHGLDAARLYLAGFSMGGYGAWRFALRHPQRFRGAAILAGATRPFTGVAGESVEQLLDALHPDTPIPPLLLLHGELDQAVPVEQARAARRRLETLGRRSEYREFPAAAHGHPDWRDVALLWLEQTDAGRR